MQRVIAFALAVVVLCGGAWSAAAQNPSPGLEDYLLLDLPAGRVAILLRPDLAPKHVERIKKLTREGFYDGLAFHRVIAGFMAQTGDPTGTGAGGSPYPDLPAEFSDEPFQRGTVGAARTSDPDSANSQFFICFEAAPWLNGQYTVIGRVVKGMEWVDRLKKGDPKTGLVRDPDRIIRMQVAADADDISILGPRGQKTH